MKKILTLLGTFASLPKDIHSLDVFLTKGYQGWRGFYDWLHPNGPPVAPAPVAPAPVPVEVDQALEHATDTEYMQASGLL